jgi:hypothetical protein
MSGKGHPLPGSGEARHGEIPEHLEREKGRGDDPGKVIQPGEEAVNPDGESYPYQDLGREPATGDRVGEGQRQDDPERDEAAHKDRGRSVAESEADGR